MTIAKNSLIIATFLFSATLSAENKFYIEPIATSLQVLGGIVLIQGATISKMGNNLIKNGYADISLNKMPSPFKTPKSMKIYGLISLPVGLTALASPLIFEKAAELGKQHRESKKNKNQNKNNDELIS